MMRHSFFGTDHMITVTLRQIMAAPPCYDPREKGLLPHDHDLDAPISFREIVEKSGPEDAIWCFCYAMSGHESLKRHFAVDCAERVRQLMTDERSLNALTVARNHALGEATDEDLGIAWAAARDAAMDAAMAARAARAARAAARDAARAARAARDAAGAAARDAAWAAAWDAAWAADMAAAGVSESAWQSERIIQLTEAGEWSPEMQELAYQQMKEQRRKQAAEPPPNAKDRREFER